MLMNVSKATRVNQRSRALTGDSDALYFTYRCYNCRRLVTKIEILEARARNQAAVCPCGSVRIQPTNTSLFEELVYPRMWKMLYAMYTKQLAPPPIPPTEEEQKQRDQKAHEAMRAHDRKMLQESSKQL